MIPSEIVREVLTDCLPEGVPPSFRRAISAEAQGRGRARIITANLEMVDGLTATVVLRAWAHGWSHRFTEMPGGALSFENGNWKRRPEDQSASRARDKG